MVPVSYTHLDLYKRQELFDTDGSDEMVKYLDLAHKVDSLYQLGE